MNWKLITFLCILTFLSYPVLNPLSQTLAHGFSVTPWTFFDSKIVFENFPMIIVDQQAPTKYTPLIETNPTRSKMIPTLKSFIGYFFGTPLNNNVQIWIGIFLSGLAIYFFAKEVLKSEKSAWLSILLFVLFGFFTFEGMTGHTNTVDAWAFILPLIILEKNYSKKKSFFFLTVSLFLLLNSELQMAYHGIIITTLYALFFRKEKLKQYFPALFLAFIFSTPFINFYLTNELGRDFSKIHFLGAEKLLPGEQFSLWFWLTPLLLLVLKDRKTALFTILGIVYILLAINPLFYKSFYDFFPFSEGFRTPYRIIVFAGFFLSVTYAKALDNIDKRILCLIIPLLLLDHFAGLSKQYYVMEYQVPTELSFLKGYNTLHYPLRNEWANWSKMTVKDVYYEPFYYYFITLHENPVIFDYIQEFPGPVFSEKIDELQSFFESPSEENLQKICDYGIDAILCIECPKETADFLDNNAIRIFSKPEMHLFTLNNEKVFLKNVYFHELTC
ncbi:MAG: hypothetical protein GOU97_03265 [Nanoarchaeota archaeon]|nr:hypothetical protein [Nanoarchaeota archaeon]